MEIWQNYHCILAPLRHLLFHIQKLENIRLLHTLLSALYLIYLSEYGGSFKLMVATSFPGSQSNNFLSSKSQSNIFLSTYCEFKHLWRGSPAAGKNQIFISKIKTPWKVLTWNLKLSCWSRMKTFLGGRGDIKSNIGNSLP